MNYWSKKVNACHIPDVNWDVLETAMKESPLTTQWFVSKDAVGLCGVGKFLKKWKDSDTDAYP
jgi:hypothetical protein